MIDLELSRPVFIKAVQQLTKGHSSDSSDLVDMIVFSEAVRFVVLGRETTIGAEVASRGAAQFPMSLLKRLTAVAKTFPGRTNRIRIETGRVRINTNSVTHADIRIHRVLARPFDIPDDAPDRDLLALRYLFTPEQAAEANLTARILAANTRYLKTLTQCAKDLADYGVRIEAVKQILDDALRSHAEALRPMLLPTTPDTSRPN